MHHAALVSSVSAFPSFIYPLFPPFTSIYCTVSLQPKPEEDDFSSNIEGIYLGECSNINTIVYVTSFVFYLQISVVICHESFLKDQLINSFFKISVFPSAGFRRSMRLCRRRSHSTTQPSCHTRCPSSCYSALNSPYEEVVRYQRYYPQDTHRLIALLGTMTTILITGK